MVGGRRREGRDSEKGGREEEGEGREGETNRVRRKGRRTVSYTHLTLPTSDGV